MARDLLDICDMKIAPFLLGLGVSLLPVCLVAQSEDFVVTSEVLEMTIERLGIDHQGPQVIDLHIAATFRDGMVQADYPDFRILYDDLHEWMEAYPNETDFWETLTKYLPTEVLKNYPTIEEVTLSIVVYPERSITYPHTVRVTMRRSGD